MAEEQLSYVPVACYPTFDRIARTVSEEFARTHRLIVLSIDDACTMAIADPDDTDAIQQVRRSTGRPVKVLVSSWPEIELGLDLAFHPTSVGETLSRSIGQLLLQLGSVTDEQLDEVLRIAATEGRPLEEIVVERHYLEEERIAETKSLRLYLPWVRLDARRISPTFAPIIPSTLAQRLEVIPLFSDDSSLFIAGPDLLGIEAIRELEGITGLRPKQVICDRPAFREAFEQTYGKAASPRKEKRTSTLAEAMLEGRFVNRQQLQSAEAVHQVTGEPLEIILLRLGHISNQELSEARAFELGVDHVDLARVDTPAEIALLIPEALSRRFRCLAFARDRNDLSVAMIDPLDTEAIEVISELTGLSIKPFFCQEEALDATTNLLYGRGRRIESRAQPWPLGRFFVRGGYISERELQMATQRQGQTNESLEESLHALDYASEEDLAEVLSLRATLPWIKLERYLVRDETVLLIPEEIAREHSLIAVHHEDRILTIAMVDPLNEEGIAAVERATGLAARVVVATPSAIHNAIERLYIISLSQLTTADREFTVYLVQRGILSSDQRWQVWRKHTIEATPIDMAISALGFLTQDEVAIAMAQYLQMEYVDIAPHVERERIFDAIGLPAERSRLVDPVDAGVAQLITEETAKALAALPIRMEGNSIVVAFANPLDEAAMAEIRRLLPRPVAPIVSCRRQILDAIRRAAGRKLIGDYLLEAEIVTETQLDHALAVHERDGVRIGKALISLGYVTQEQLSTFIAEQQEMAFFDLSGTIIDDQVARTLPEEFEREHRLIPILMNAESITIAMVDPLNQSAIDEVGRITGLQVHTVHTTDDAFSEAMEDIYRDDYLQRSASELVFRYPDESAFRVLSLRQKIFGLLFLGASTVLVAVDYVLYLLLLNAVANVFYIGSALYKLYLIYRALSHQLEVPTTAEELAALDERDLPIYTLLIPLYREAQVLPRLIRGIEELDYPDTKLDVKLLLEEDDVETIAAVMAYNLPSYVKPVIVPDAPPKGKPKACNYGLIHAEGKYSVIYDAEDVPEPDQLKKAVVAFNKVHESVVCIQAKLNYYNRDQNLLTKWFTTEYSTWFDLFLPGLDAADAPIPLGGTSNHFPTAVLQQLGGWDPHNVTEDADLGMRIYKSGYKTAVIDSTTFEEANSQLYNWIRQRSRWVKGYIQTYLVHMRHPFGLWRYIGTTAFFSFNMVVGGTFISFLLNPIYWGLTSLWFLTEWGLIRELYPPILFYVGSLSLYIGNFVYVYVHAAGCLRRGYYDLVRYALIIPIYWALMSVGAWKGLIQLLYKPSYWEKTTHGLYTEEVVTTPTQTGARPVLVSPEST